MTKQLSSLRYPVHRKPSPTPLITYTARLEHGRCLAFSLETNSITAEEPELSDLALSLSKITRSFSSSYVLTNPIATHLAHFHTQQSWATSKDVADDRQHFDAATSTTCWPTQPSGLSRPKALCVRKASESPSNTIVIPSRLSGKQLASRQCAAWNYDADPPKMQ